MYDDAGEDDLSAVIGDSFAESGCQSAESLEPVGASLDRATQLVRLGVEGWSPATSQVLGLMTGDLVGALGWWP